MRLNREGSVAIDPVATGAADRSRTRRVSHGTANASIGCRRPRPVLTEEQRLRIFAMGDTRCGRRPARPNQNNSLSTTLSAEKIHNISVTALMPLSPTRLLPPSLIDNGRSLASLIHLTPHHFYWRSSPSCCSATTIMIQRPRLSHSRAL